MKLSLPMIRIKEEILKRESHSERYSKGYDYFATKISRMQIEMNVNLIKDERFHFFLKYGALRRIDGDCDVIYVEIPQIPKKLVVYRRPTIRIKSIDKFDLARKELPHIPLFEGEERLQYLSLEMNMIKKIEDLISLGNLIYLNLYSNRIKEIENLEDVNKLRVLILGKNKIEKIKNLSCLKELEILDLHSNRIKVIENLEDLQKLRTINIANNLITSLEELFLNKNLEEINIRKNLIEEIPSLQGQFEKIKKINIAKNLINDMIYIFELKSIPSIVDLIIDDNPVFLTKNKRRKLPFIRNNINPLQKYLTLSTTMREKNSTISTQSSSCRNTNRTLTNCNSTYEHIPKKESSKILHKVVSKGEKIIKEIKSEWESENKKSILLRYNGYNSQIYKNNKISIGHFEVIDKHLIIYGNSLTILENEQYQSQITSISFNFFYYDVIMTQSTIDMLNRFKKLKSLSFSDNNIHSYYQLTQLKKISSLENVSISNNEVTSSYLLKYFMIYRIKNLKSFNDISITQDDVTQSQKLFEYFDKCISNSEKIKKEASSSVIIDKTAETYYSYVKSNVLIALKEIIDDYRSSE